MITVPLHSLWHYEQHLSPPGGMDIWPTYNHISVYRYIHFVFLHATRMGIKFPIMGSGMLPKLSTSMVLKSYCRDGSGGCIANTKQYIHDKGGLKMPTSVVDILNDILQTYYPQLALK